MTNDRYFQPLVNPDGYEYALNDTEWIKNRNRTDTECLGVNLLRNYDFQFGGVNTSGDPCENNYRGPEAFSEAETFTHRNFFETSKEQFGAFLIISTDVLPYIMYPFSYGDFVPYDYEELDRIGKESSEVRSNRKFYGLRRIHPSYLITFFYCDMRLTS